VALTLADASPNRFTLVSRKISSIPSSSSAPIFKASDLAEAMEERIDPIHIKKWHDGG